MNVSKQLDLFTVDEPENLFNIYHDESGTYKKDRWFIVGLLLIRAEDEPQVFEALQKVRADVGYQGEVHFSSLPKSWQGEFSVKAIVARRWLHVYSDNLSQICYFYALAVDTQSKAFEHRRFPRRHFAYNRFTRMALVSAIAWQLHKVRKLVFQVYSDEKCRGARSTEMTHLLSTDWDNFESYIPYSVAQDVAVRESLSNKRYPSIRPLGDVITIDPRRLAPSASLPRKAELIQLADLLLGATAEAIVALSGQPTKIDLAMTVANWIADTRKEPWRQQFHLHRRFSVSYFPDKNGRSYSEGELRVLSRGSSQQLQFQM